MAARSQVAKRNLIGVLLLRLAQFANAAFVINGRPECAIEIDVSRPAFSALKLVIRNLSGLATRDVKVERYSMLPVIACT